MSRYKHTESEVRVIRAMAKMPYGTLVEGRIAWHNKPGFNSSRSPVGVTLDDIANWIETLSAVIGEAVTRDQLELVLLRELHNDVNAMRRVLGLKEDSK